ncbi:Gp19/Gp15/Gp42 family protein [Paenarthrobacter sp. NPDC090520]|uniref:Gp19/Gp15/Gp42 family protein n=1 Tax=Paenarthrobacter sp. NPDC090520 TaxID=3364382 RepID=UPI00381AD900
MAEDLAELETVEKAWRPLRAAEKPKAEYYLGMASRAIRRRWRDVDERIANPGDLLTAEDVADVVVQMVLSAVEGSPVRGAKSFSKTTGPMSLSATFEAGSTNPSNIEDWMVEVFEGRATVEPRFWAPPAGRYESIFEWPEGVSQ